MLSGEATNTNFIDFGSTRPRLEPTIYRTRGKHTNHYATDAVDWCLIVKPVLCDLPINSDIGSHKTDGHLS